MEFFNEAKEQSIVKSNLVTKYFDAWSRIISSWANKMAYIDLYAGPGVYEDGTKSTPVRIVEQAVANPKVAERLVAIFNDADPDNAKSLKDALDNVAGVEGLTYQPVVKCAEVDEDTAKQFKKMTLVPTFSFIDPFGYKGLSLGLIQAVVKDWGCDSIFFFNYNRINMGLPNELVNHHMDGLFGAERAERLRQAIADETAERREALIVEGMCEALRDFGAEYVLPFRFRHPKHGRVSHHLIFVSKHPLGYGIMKDIMASESSSDSQGVPSFEYNPRVLDQGLLFSLSTPLDDLQAELLSTFAGQTLTRDEVFEEHHINTPFVKKNYNDALHELEESGEITVVRPPRSNAKRKGRFTYGKKTKITFPATS